MGGLLTDGMAMVAEGDQAETFATSIGQALTNAFASDEVLEQTATAMQGVVANMGQGLLSNQALVTDSVATVSEQGNADGGQLLRRLLWHRASSSPWASRLASRARSTKSPLPPLRSCARQSLRHAQRLRWHRPPRSCATRWAQ